MNDQTIALCFASFILGVAIMAVLFLTVLSDIRTIYVYEKAQICTMQWQQKA